MRHLPVLLLLCCCAATAKPPHIVLLLADDLGWNDVGYHGSEIRTPHIDQLAREGIRLEAFYAQTVCMPSRAALMTGQYPMRHGLVFGNRYADGKPGLHLDIKLLPRFMKDHGYYTAILGKWHLGAAGGYRPEKRGFDYQYGGYLGSLDYFTHQRRGELHWFRNGKPLYEKGYITNLMAREAQALIERHNPKQPLFLYVPFNAPHVPLQAPEKAIAAYADSIPSKKRRTFAAMVSSMDKAIGAIRTALQERGMLEETLIIFLSDNGGAPVDGASNEPYAAGKTSPREGGIRVPCVFHWPAKLQPGSNDNVAHIVDLLPTLAHLAGAKELPNDLDGRNIWPMLTEGAGTPHEELLLVHNHRARSLRRGDWKLIVRKLPKQQTLLFNVREDPYEENDRAEAEPARVAELLKRLETYQPPKPAEGIERRRRSRD